MHDEKRGGWEENKEIEWIGGRRGRKERREQCNVLIGSIECTRLLQW